jgi:hypothetical protein
MRRASCAGVKMRGCLIAQVRRRASWHRPPIDDRNKALSALRGKSKKSPSVNHLSLISSRKALPLSSISPLAIFYTKRTHMRKSRRLHGSLILAARPLFMSFVEMNEDGAWRGSTSPQTYVAGRAAHARRMEMMPGFKCCLRNGCLCQARRPLSFL